MWEVPEPPLPPQDAPRLERYDDAFLTRSARGPIRSYDSRLKSIVGAVYDRDGRLVMASQKIGGIDGNQYLATDPRAVSVPQGAVRVPGRWLYGGHWIQHFGHFVTETITTLWTEQRDFDGVVFHKFLRAPVVIENWMRFFLTELGFHDLPIEIIDRRAMRFESLAVPGRSVVANGFAHPQARTVWDQVAARFRDDRQDERVYLSRTRFHQELRRTGRADWRRVRTAEGRDHRLDELFGAAGFQVAFPETMSVEDQVALVANASVVAGQSGSALHLAAFARAGTHVLEIGDSRTPSRGLSMQRVIAAVSSQPMAFVGADEDDGSLRDLLASLDDPRDGILRRPRTPRSRR